MYCVSILKLPNVFAMCEYSQVLWPFKVIIYWPTLYNIGPENWYKRSLNLILSSNVFIGKLWGFFVEYFNSFLPHLMGRLRPFSEDTLKKCIITRVTIYF